MTTAHGVEHFVLGKVAYDPGWIFYLFALSIKSTPFILPLAIIGMIWLWKEKKEAHSLTNQADKSGPARRPAPTTQQLRIAGSLICGVLIFTICLALTSKKFIRYLLPVFPMLDMLAGLGLFYSVKWVGRQFRPAYFRQIGQITCVVLVFTLTAAPGFALPPYYGTYYNLCWRLTDITKIITVGEAAGLDLAARYLNEKPNARQLRVAVSPLGTEFFQYYFVGFAYHANKNYLPADYEVVYVRDSQIGQVPQTGTRNGELEHTIILNGIAQVRIYRVSQNSDE